MRARNTCLKNAESGFTLLELMVALTLLSFLTILLYESARVGINTWRRSGETLRELNHVRIAQAVISRDLQEAYPLYVEDDNKSHIRFDGRSDQLMILTADQSHPGVLTQVSIKLQKKGDGFSLIRKSVLELSSNGIPATTTLLQHVRTVKFTYFGAVEHEEPKWLPAWRDKSMLPELVRVQIQLDGRGRSVSPDWIIAPRLAADATCVLNALTHSCGGL